MDRSLVTVLVAATDEQYCAVPTLPLLDEKGLARMRCRRPGIGNPIDAAAGLDDRMAALYRGQQGTGSEVTVRAGEGSTWRSLRC